MNFIFCLDLHTVYVSHNVTIMQEFIYHVLKVQLFIQINITNKCSFILIEYSNTCVRKGKVCAIYCIFQPNKIKNLYTMKG